MRLQEKVAIVYFSHNRVRARRRLGVRRESPSVPGRIVRTLGEHGPTPLDELGPRIRVDYAPGGEYGREWLRGLLADLSDEGLIEIEEHEGDTITRLRH